MKYVKFGALLAITALFIVSCEAKTSDKVAKITKVKTFEKEAIQDLSKYETAYFASGCFWCVEAVFESVKGVKEVISGYSGGTEKNPTYEKVGRGLTSHAEAVEVYYDPKVVSFNTLVRVFFGSHDPTTLNRQGPDRGPQYRSIAFYKNEKERESIIHYVEKLEQERIFSRPIVTEIVPFKVFYKAEEYHQDFERKHPNNPYIRNVSVPRLRSFQRKYPELLKDSH
ncbi:peptide-methionine (S)-S-oxide reductase MsrA [Leptobacterium flavescens]|uniref:Peptide methionine sulfoxide reductase MsrA n=1 Tax=Leptobacterium flavescens TaxID=472055 RepID=A0A6P0UFZ4_9FLAO|nr:peptide-methionine (S)-S-oxide reductase MsrA [Leptobacterium flavescens]NER12201.1 peptide-methionine (S)-S-oxide reductase MsrA [Leptobacterium flavescens]